MPLPRIGSCSRYHPRFSIQPNSYALIAGDGLDYKVTPRFSIRPIQADYVYMTYPVLARRVSVTC